MTDQIKRALSAAQNTPTPNQPSDDKAEQSFDMSESSYKTTHTAVRKARRFAMQGLYEWLVTDRRFDLDGKLGWKDNAPHDIAARTRATNAMHTVHIGYYHEMMRDIPEQVDALDALIAQHLDRGVDQLDTIEHAILLIGAYELQNRIEIPYKVVLDEAMKLNTHFGATDAHKLINAVLDKIAVETRAIEVQADTDAGKRRPKETKATTSAASQPLAADKSDDNLDNRSDNHLDNSAVADKKPVSNKPRISANKAGVKRAHKKSGADIKALAAAAKDKAKSSNNTHTDDKNTDATQNHQADRTDNASDD